MNQLLKRSTSVTLPLTVLVCHVRVPNLAVAKF